MLMITSISLMRKKKLNYKTSNTIENRSRNIETYIIILPFINVFSLKYNFYFPCHIEVFERSVKLVTEAFGAVYEDGFKETVLENQGLSLVGICLIFIRKKI